MDEPVRNRLRPARHRGLTRPDQVTVLPRPSGRQPAPPQRKPGQAAEQASGGKATPGKTSRSPIRRLAHQDERQNLRGGSRLSAHILIPLLRGRYVLALFEASESVGCVNRVELAGSESVGQAQRLAWAGFWAAPCGWNPSARMPPPQAPALRLADPTGWFSGAEVIGCSVPYSGRACQERR
jgi:hypothetical protein